MVSIARGITVFLGAYATFFLYEGYNALEHGQFATVEDAVADLLSGAVMILLHVIIVFIAFPFMFYSVVIKDSIPTWFALVLGIESTLNAIFMWLILDPFATEDRRTVIFVILELLPVLMLWYNQEKIGKPKS